MLCDVCKKKEAVVHYTEVVHGKIKKLHLCEECANKKGIGMQVPFSIGELMGGLTTPVLGKGPEKEIICSSCGMKLSELRKTGRLGCSYCYESFNKKLVPILNNIHKSTRHIGKVPGSARKIMGAMVKIRKLELKLQEAVRKEEFEQAAKIRDEIRVLQKKQRMRKVARLPDDLRRNKK